MKKAILEENASETAPVDEESIGVCGSAVLLL